MIEKIIRKKVHALYVSTCISVLQTFFVWWSRWSYTRLRNRVATAKSHADLFKELPCISGRNNPILVRPSEWNQKSWRGPLAAKQPRKGSPEKCVIWRQGPHYRNPGKEEATVRSNHTLLTWVRDNNALWVSKSQQPINYEGSIQI